jgi:hypothetical protein
MIPTENEETKTSERSDPPGEAKEEGRVSERIKREISTANSVDGLTEIYRRHKDHWSEDLSTLAAARKKYLTMREQIEATRSHSFPSAIESQLSELDTAWDKFTRSAA